ncbi:MAG: DMT family transporter [Wolinella succinogenes]|uniref:DMT family transporter n=1 Tax=Wolinella succinogenes TaxID=844 RepID=UPI00168E6992|nr:DMT family transporter [Wolinella succinogenes]NLU34510.1 DMT family transporter [Wolinella succinogenes]
MESRAAVGVLFGASILWGLSWMPLKYLYSLGIGGLTLGVGAYGILTLLFGASLYGARPFLSSWVKPLLCVAFLGGGANLAFSYALIHGEVIRVMALFYLLPLWGVLGGKIFLGERVDGWRILGAFLALVGAFWVVGGTKVFEGEFSFIDLIALLSGVLFAGNNIAFRGLEAVSLRAKLGAMFGGCFALSFFLLLLGVEPFPYEIPWESWGFLALYALFWLLLANLGSQWGVTQMEAGRSSIIIITELIVATLSAAIWLGERLQSWELIGGICIVTSALMEAFRSQETPKKGENR